MRASFRTMRRRHSLLFGALLIQLWAPRLWAACDSPGERQISIQFSRGFDEAFTRAVEGNVRAGAGASEKCPSSVAGGKASQAVIQIEASGAERVTVNVDFSEGGLESHVSRSVELAAIPHDSRAFAVALAVDELLGADWAGPAPADVAAPPIREEAPLASDQGQERGMTQPGAKPGYPWRLSVGAVMEHFEAGQTHWGGDVSVLVPVYERIGWRLSAGIRRGLEMDAPDGQVRSRALSFASDATYLVWRAPLEVGLTLGAHGEWIELSGLTTDGNASARDLSGLALYVRTGVAAAMHVAPPLWLEAGACIGVPLRGLEATDGGELATGASGLQLSVVGGVAIEL
jgi:hypothetical protein